MKAILWGSVALLALLWTIGAALLARAVHWSAKRMSMSTEPTLTFEMATSSVVIPVWLAAWFDPIALSTILEMMQHLLGSFFSVLPTVGMVMAWLIPAIWITWALGMLILLVAINRYRLCLKQM